MSDELKVVEEVVVPVQEEAVSVEETVVLEESMGEAMPTETSE